VSTLTNATRRAPDSRINLSSNELLWLSDDVATGVRLPEQVPSADPDPPGSLSLGTTNFETVLGAGVAAEVLTRWDRRQLAAHENRLLELLLNGLATNPAVRLLGPGFEPARSPLVKRPASAHARPVVQLRSPADDR